MMEKDFDGWNEIKKKLDSRTLNFYYRERNIYWCNLGLNLGKESNGKNNNFSRPVLILKKFNKHTCLIAPITKSSKRSEYLIEFEIEGEINKANTSQIKVISSKRLQKFIYRIDKLCFENIKEKIRDYLL